MPWKIFISEFETPLGKMIAGGNDDGLCLMEFADRPALPRELDDLQKLLNAEIENGEHPITNLAKIQIEEYFRGDRTEFNLPVNAPGTTFQKKVWDVLQSIPYGTTRTYKDQAVILGNINYIRAVGKANGDNRISIIIPCHRVIGTNGDLIGYGGGKWRKKKLLEFEAHTLGNLTLF